VNDPYAPPARLLVAVGGNAIHPGDIRGTPAEQLDIAKQTGAALLPIMRMDNELVITHGNGPVVGKILMRQAIACDRVAPMTMDICVAHSQGGIAYLLMQALENALREAGNGRHVVCMLTQVEVDPDDPAFTEPTKPVGFFFDAEEARRVGQALGWEMREESGRGFRHVVPSPEPQHIVDISLVETLVRSGTVVIAGGGGGIPVVRAPNGVRRGVEAVIDKDLSSAHLASVLGLEVMMILTEAPAVAVHYGTPHERPLGEVPVSELRRYQAEGHFPVGSMGPKVEAAARFVERGGRRAVVASLFEAEAALAGRAGTQVLPDEP
jgi:carbamate kinase